MKMRIKETALVLSLAVCASPAYAAPWMPVTGADMAGIEVTAYFAGGGSETITWATMGTDAGPAYLEGFSGGTFGTNWSLTQQGDTIGDITGSGQLLGVWTLASAANLERLEINALVAGFAFDTEFGMGGALGDAGRPFVSDQATPPTATYSDLFGAPDLYGTLALDWGTTDFNGIMEFMADTDDVSAVPEPATALLLGAGLIGMAGAARARKQKQKA